MKTTMWLGRRYRIKRVQSGSDVEWTVWFCDTHETEFKIVATARDAAIALPVAALEDVLGVLLASALEAKP